MTKWFTIIDLNARDQAGTSERRRAGARAASASGDRALSRDPRSMRARMDAYLRGDWPAR